MVLQKDEIMIIKRKMKRKEQKTASRKKTLKSSEWLRASIKQAQKNSPIDFQEKEGIEEKLCCFNVHFIQHTILTTARVECMAKLEK
ncbi:CLUMA_CG004480, isoform A [Clunio marinus]|uniref:CLUMA_CG004480, isoform A n=1 Tax=Clunio marinus TaxID=568069 RepID=A0A1J1HTT7_9DIPT|nr:CLUMA_CG004480, isoform A [Clunio marinus]